MTERKYGVELRGAKSRSRVVMGSWDPDRWGSSAQYIAELIAG